MATILIVDDHPTNRELVATLIKYQGHRPLEAADGAEALALVRSQRPELVISDVLMPTMDGYEFVRQLRADPAIASTPVIFYTAHYREREARNLARAAGVEHVLVKPCEPGEILDAIQQSLSRQPAAPVPNVEDEFDREHLRLMTDKLSENVAQLQAANLRLEALTDFNLHLASERDPQGLLERVCRGARDLVGAKYALIFVGDKNGSASRFFTTCGIDAATGDTLTPPTIDSGVFAEVLSQRQTRRMRIPGDDPAAIGLPAGYPAAASALVAPVVSLNAVYGWLCLLGKLGGDEFGVEDEQILGILAAQVGRIYENGILYQEIQRNAEQLERRVAERTAELKLANRELEAFSYTVSHDLRAPLRAIQGFTQIIREQHGKDFGPETDHLFARVQSNAVRMSKLIDDLLAFARVGREEVAREPVALEALVHKCLDNLREEIVAAKAEAVVGTLPNCTGDPGLLTQVFENLLSNALKFSARQDHPRIEVGSLSRDGEVALFVRDNGVGFDMKHAGRLFEVFQRLHARSDFEGTGVGLATVRRIVERHGGRAWAESRPGEGTTIWFTLGRA